MFYQRNQIYAVDCLSALSQFEDNSIDLLLTDIPYNEVNRKSNGLRNLDKADADILNFDLQAFVSQCCRTTKGTIYIFCGTNQVSGLREMLVEAGLSTRQCVWQKTNPSPMNGQHVWLSSIENCIFAKKKNAVFNEHCKGAVWTFASERSKIHPTQKPVKLFQYLIETSSKPGDLVVDPCIGSGTTAIAALRTGRDYIGFDMSSQYVEQAHQRIVLEIGSKVTT